MGKTIYYLDSTLTRDSTTIIADSSYIVGDKTDEGHLLWNLLFDIEGKQAISTISSHVGRIEGNAENGVRRVLSYVSRIEGGVERETAGGRVVPSHVGRIEGGVERGTKKVVTATSFMGVLKSEASWIGAGTRIAGSHVGALFTSIIRLGSGSRQVGSHIQPILTSTSRVFWAGRVASSYIRSIHTKVSIHTERRWYVLPHPVTAWETEGLYWLLEDDLSQEVFDFTKYVGEGGYLAIEDQVSLAWGPEEIGTPGDYSRLWVAYAKDDQTIWLARTDETFSFWEKRFQIASAPTGATYPSLGFDRQGQYEIAVEFTPAGSEQAEVWLIEWPYVSGTTNKIVDGNFPVLVMLNTLDRALFYQNHLNKTQILYRLSSEDWDVAHTLSIEGTTGNLRALAYRMWSWGYSIHPQVHYSVYEGLLFFGEAGEELPRYIQNAPHIVQDPFIQKEELQVAGSLEGVDWEYRVFQITFHVYNALDSSPLEGATVTSWTSSGVTDSQGNVTLSVLVGVEPTNFTVSHSAYVDTTDSFHTDADTTVSIGLLPVQELVFELAVSGSLEDILWNEVVTEEVPGEEHNELDMSIAISLVDITILQESLPKEELKVSGSLQSILWIEV